MIDDLYNTDILALSATLRNERLDAPDGTSRKVSKLCGSWVEIDVVVEEARVAKAALRVQACALGQASAAILKESIEGASLDELKNARDALRDMLKADGEPPTGRFEKLALLKDVKAYPARHTSTLLAFEAAVEAVEVASSHT
jgi:NifU-like protein involved in Fe-S cluster formation